MKVIKSKQKETTDLVIQAINLLAERTSKLRRDLNIVTIVVAVLFLVVNIVIVSGLPKYSNPTSVNIEQAVKSGGLSEPRK